MHVHNAMVSTTNGQVTTVETRRRRSVVVDLSVSAGNVPLVDSERLADVWLWLRVVSAVRMLLSVGMAVA